MCIGIAGIQLHKGHQRIAIGVYGHGRQAGNIWPVVIDLRLYRECFTAIVGVLDKDMAGLFRHLFVHDVYGIAMAGDLRPCPRLCKYGLCARIDLYRLVKCFAVELCQECFAIYIAPQHQRLMVLIQYDTGMEIAIGLVRDHDRIIPDNTVFLRESG